MTTETPRPKERRGPPLDAIWLGRRPYAAVLALQERLFEARRNGQGSDTVLFLEHEPVITEGRGTRPGHVLVSPEELTRLDVARHTAGRGGDVTLHAPGQLVGYPLVALDRHEQDVRRYVRALAATMRRVAEAAEISAGEHPAGIGLWADRAARHEWRGEGAQDPVKLGAIGVRFSRWVTMHGFALNTTIDLGWYRLIVPCGIREHDVASLSSLGGLALEPRAAAEIAFTALATELGREARSWRTWEGGALETIAIRA